MIKHILFPFDFSQQVTQAAASVRALATKFGASVTMLSVVPPGLQTVLAGSEADATTRQRALRARLDQAAMMPDLAGVPTTRLTDEGDPGTRIVEAAHRYGVDLIMMPTHGVGLVRELMVGSTTAKVLHDAQCPVWTAAHAGQQGAAGLPRQILCAVDEVPESRGLLRWAAAFSAEVGASLQVLHVVSLVPDWPTPGSERALAETLREESRARLEALLKAENIRGVPLRIAVGDIVPQVAECALEQRADLVIIGRGHATAGRLRTHVHGIIQSSACPVLSV